MDYRETFVKLFTDASRDKPSRPSVRVVDGCWTLTIKGNRDKWAEMVQAACVPAHAEQHEDGDTLAVRWSSVADQIFGAGGLLAQNLTGYEVRAPQLHMARLIQRGIEMGEPVIVEAGTGTGKCLHPDTLITLASGVQRPIHLLASGFQGTIVQANSQLKMQHGTYAHCWASGVKQTYRLTTRLGHEIKASADHRFLTVDGWKRLSELQPGDHVATPRFVPEPLHPCPMPEAEVKLLGYMLSDGCSSQAGYKGVVKYSTNDPIIVQDLASTVGKMENLELVRASGPHEYNIRRIVSRVGADWKRNQAIVLMETTGLAGKKAPDKTIPDCIFGLPNKQLSLFLGCLFSGDGSVDTNRRTVEFYSTSRRMLNQIQHLLLRFSVISRVSIKNGRYLGEHHQSWRLTISGITNIYRFHESISLVGEKQGRFTGMDFSCPSNPNFDIVPKSALQGRHIPKRFGVNAGHKGVSRRNLEAIAAEFGDTRLGALATSDIYWDSIVSIEPDEVVETYDIEMVGEHNFLADGFIVHNSFAYAAVAMAMNKKVVISTSNKALQAQLYQKDIPFLCRLFPGKKVALAQGKSNYMCRAKCQGGISDYALGEWYKTTDSGNVEELDFHVKELSKWTVDEDCTGRRCSFYGTCFYYMAKAERQHADVIICNHALLILDRLYPQANILPGCNVVVVDEAHKLAEYARGAIGQEFTLGSISKILSLAMDSLTDTAATADAERLLQLFYGETSGYLAAATAGARKDRQIGVKGDQEFPAGQRLAAELYEIADQVWNPEDMPEDDYAIKLAKRANKIRNKADQILVASSATPEGSVRWIEPEMDKHVCVPFDVSAFIGRMAGFETTQPGKVSRTHCTRCNRALTAATVHVLDGLAYGPDCIRHVDAFGDAEIMPLVQWLDIEAEEPVTRHDPTAIIFTSATIAAPDLAHFMRECGISHGFQMVADSPFDYESNALLYIPNGETPIPNAKEWPSYVIEDVRKLVMAAKGGAFLLFTSYSNLKNCSTYLRHIFEGAGLACYVQGELPKGEIAKRFREDGNAVLFATKSFWEGISIEGAALRLVVIDKMPFQAPSPLLKARETTVKNAFTDLHVPEMVIDLKQGAGRLIRRMDDYGVIALLDSRARLKPYGRNMVIPAMPPARLVHNIYEVSAFFDERREKDFSNAAVDFPVHIDQAVFDELEDLGF